MSRLVIRHGLPRIHWTVRTTMAAQQVRARLSTPIDIDLGADDFGMVMHDAMRTDLVASLRRYTDAHSQWDLQVTKLAKHLQSMKIQAVLADVPYLTLAAASQAGIPSMALCSLNWADILLQCVMDNPAALTDAGVSTTQFDTIIKQISDAYNQTEVFLCPEPSMAMPLIRTTVPIGPVFEMPTDPDRSQLAAWARKHACQQPGWFVLVSMGGIPTQLNMSGWPSHCLGKPIYYIIAGTQTIDIPRHFLSAQSWELDYATLFASCDLVISKPGYGTFVEAASLSKPLIYIERPGWPESNALTTWLEQRGHTRALLAEQLNTEVLSNVMSDLLSQTPPTRLEPSGNLEAAKRFLEITNTR